MKKENLKLNFNKEIISKLQMEKTKVGETDTGITWSLWGCNTNLKTRGIGFCPVSNTKCDVTCEMSFCLVCNK